MSVRNRNRSLRSRSSPAGSTSTTRSPRTRPLGAKAMPFADDGNGVSGGPHPPHPPRKRTIINETRNTVRSIHSFDDTAAAKSLLKGLSSEALWDKSQKVNQRDPKEHSQEHPQEHPQAEWYARYASPPRSAHSSAGSSRKSQRKSMLRHGTFRCHPAALEDENDIDQPFEREPPPPKPVKRDIWGHLPHTPKFKPGDRTQTFRPEHVTRQAVFKEDCLKAAKSEDIGQLLAVYSMALDLDAFLASSSIMLASRHEVEALKRQLRKIMKAKVDTAVNTDTSESLTELQEVFDQIQRDYLLKALTKFPEVYRGWAFLQLRLAEEDVEKLENNNVPREDVLLALEKAIKRARRVESLDSHAGVAEKLLTRAGGVRLADASSPDKQPEAEFEDERVPRRQQSAGAVSRDASSGKGSSTSRTPKASRSPAGARQRSTSRASAHSALAAEARQRSTSRASGHSALAAEARQRQRSTSRASGHSAAAAGARQRQRSTSRASGRSMNSSVPSVRSSGSLFT